MYLLKGIEINVENNTHYQCPLFKNLILVFLRLVKAYYLPNHAQKENLNEGFHPLLSHSYK